jgi:hypothetical protein
MMQPPRYDDRHPKPKRRHHYCATCQADLGIVRGHHQGGAVLFPTAALAGALRSTEPQTFQLICTAGHWTAWHGSGIKWFTSEQEAA